jgi:hypothetical protein
MKNAVIVTLVFLYAVTWAGGWISHSREIRSRARRMYADAQKYDREIADTHQKAGLSLHDAPSRLNKDGPSADVNWCIPLLPGVLLADSWYVIGPRWGEGGGKIVLYYGFGSRELNYRLCRPWGWQS